MTAKKSPEEKYLRAYITLRPDQKAKVEKLQAEKRLSAVCQKAIDAEP